MRHIIWNRWDETQWQQIAPLYRQAFPNGAKTKEIIKIMFDKRMCELHAGIMDNEEPAAMALTGRADNIHALIIDYFAVRRDLRNQGIGSEFLRLIQAWAKERQRLEGIIIEAEAAPTEENDRRRQFWMRNGFRQTEYVHRYIWVPETYQALYLPFGEGARLPEDGESLFRHITAFHRRAYGRA